MSQPCSPHHGPDAVYRAPSPDYARRRPEKGVLYSVVAEYYNTFLATVAMEGKHLPAHVIREFEAFLDCGILAKGFVRFSCASCSMSELWRCPVRKGDFAPVAEVG